jgi:cytochrome c553
MTRGAPSKLLFIAPVLRLVPVLLLVVSTGVVGRAQEAPPAQVAPCAACHSTDPNSRARVQVRLTGLSEFYLLKQLKDFRTNRRPSAVMTRVAVSLKKKDLELLATYYAEASPGQGTVSDAAVAARGKTLYEEGNPMTGVPNCVGCHGPDGGDSPKYPRLSGQVATYTAAQLAAFRSGTRTNDRAGVMRTIAAGMTDDEMKAVAEYIAGLPVNR